MSVQERNTAVVGEYVRLYCTFLKNGQMADPQLQPVVHIVENEYEQESSSSDSTADLSESSSESSERADGAFGPIYAQKETRGTWYVDWFIPAGTPTGLYYDIWTFQWTSNDEPEKRTFEIDVHTADNIINWVSPNVVHKIDDKAAYLLNDLENDFIYEAMHIPVYWEQALPRGDNKTFHLAYQNWQRNYRVLVRKNNEITLDGWYTDYNGILRFNNSLDPEDSIFVNYYFSYFSEEELLDFLLLGLKMMNSIPPASETYNSLNNAPSHWDAAILTYAGATALKRLVFGFNFQERAFVLAEDPAEQQRKIDNFKQMYSEYNEIFNKVSEDVKTKKLPNPGMAQIVVPEYTLPGGRSRWFRYLYK